MVPRKDNPSGENAWNYIVTHYLFYGLCSLVMILGGILLNNINNSVRDGSRKLDILQNEVSLLGGKIIEYNVKLTSLFEAFARIQITIDRQDREIQNQQRKIDLLFGKSNIKTER
jgi:hypothetical protein